MEPKIKKTENPWLLLFLEIIVGYLQWGAAFGGKGRGLIVAAGIVISFYSLVLSISRISEQKRKVHIGYIILILPSLYIGFVALALLFTF